MIGIRNPFRRGDKSYLTNGFSREQKQHLLTRIWGAPNQRKEMQSLSQQYNVKMETLKSWVQRHKTVSSIQAHGGRKKIFDETAEAEIRSKVTDGIYQPRVTTMKSFLVDQAGKTLEREGNSAIQANVSKQTRLRLMDRLGVKVVGAEKMTNARDQATRDIYTYVTFAAMNNSLVVRGGVKADLIFNFDGTSHTVGGSGGDDDKVWIIPEKKKKEVEVIKKPSCGVKTDPGAKGDQEFTKYTIKQVILMSAAGQQCDPVFILADPNLTPEECCIYPVKGLGVGTNFDNLGNVVIMNDRSGNREFYRWLILDVLVPWIDKIRDYYELGIEKTAYVNFDGEDVQINPMFDEDIVQLLKEKNIQLGKVPGSSTQNTQAADAGHVFISIKTTNKGLNDHSVKHQTPLIDRLTAVFKAHNAYLNSPERGDARLKGRKKKTVAADAIEMNPQHVRLAKYGLLRVLMALQNSLRPHMIRESFQVVGVWPFSLDRTLSNCKTPIRVNDKANIESQLEALTDNFEENGEISDFDLQNTFGIAPTFPFAKSKDALVLSRRRAVQLTHPKIVEKQQKYYRDRDAKKVVKAGKRGAKRIANNIEDVMEVQVSKKLKLTLRK